jgi:predicted RNA-binding protein (virulence factor B family)
LEFNDQSSPEAIRETFGVSKKAFKQAVGALLRQRQIRFEGDGIELVVRESIRD